jgi:pimeloyl-ACP methyl ester carboxylesterase
MHTTTSRDGTTVAYVSEGHGDPLVLVPGAFSYRRYPGLVKLAGPLAARFTVYSYDRRGRGDSGDTKPYAVEREIEDLAAVIDAAGGHAHVWGLSSGAVPALEAAAAGLPIRRLAVHEPPFVVAFVLTMLRLMPKAWKTLTAVAPSLPYDAAIMRGYQEGRPLPADQ